MTTKADFDSKVTTVETYSTTLNLKGLTPNTQYIAYIQTISTKTNKVSFLLSDFSNIRGNAAI